MNVSGTKEGGESLRLSEVSWGKGTGLEGVTEDGLPCASPASLGGLPEQHPPSPTLSQPAPTPGQLFWPPYRAAGYPGGSYFG